MVKREVERESYISDSLHLEHAYLPIRAAWQAAGSVHDRMKLKESMHQLKQLRRPLHQRILVKDSNFQFYTGLLSREIFNLVMSTFMPGKGQVRRNLPPQKSQFFDTSKVSAANELLI